MLAPRLQRLMPETENVLGRVDIAVVGLLTTPTSPFSFSKALDPRRSGLCQAGTTRLCCAKLSHQQEHPLPSTDLVFKELDQATIGRVVGGFRAFQVQIANENLLIGSRKLCRDLVQVVLPNALDFAIDSGCLLSLAVALRLGKLQLVLAIGPRIFEPFLVRSCCNARQTEVNANRIFDWRFRERIHFASNADVPLSCCVLNKRSGEDFTFDFLRLEEPIPGSAKLDFVVLNFDRVRLERNPTKAFSVPPTELALVRLFSRLSIGLTNRLNGHGRDIEHLCRSRSQVGEVVAGQEAVQVLDRFATNLVAVVPNKVCFARCLLQRAQTFVTKFKFISYYHITIIHKNYNLQKLNFRTSHPRPEGRGFPGSRDK